MAPSGGPRSHCSFCKSHLQELRNHLPTFYRRKLPHISSQRAKAEILCLTSLLSAAFPFSRAGGARDQNLSASSLSGPPTHQSPTAPPKLGPRQAFSLGQRLGKLSCLLWKNV